MFQYPQTGTAAWRTAATRHFALWRCAGVPMGGTKVTDRPTDRQRVLKHRDCWDAGQVKRKERIALHSAMVHVTPNVISYCVH